jgi:uncharacterized repeat protein (TIGR01451 family)
MLFIDSDIVENSNKLNMKKMNMFLSNWYKSTLLCGLLLTLIIVGSPFGAGRAYAQATGQAPATLALPIQNGTNIKWYKDGVIISGATSTTYSATTAGTYYAQYDDPSACTGRSTISIVLTLGGTSDLGLTVTPLTLTSNKGETQQYLITVTNNGPSAATNATVKVPIPIGRSFLAAQTSAGSYDGGTQIWTVGPLANGANATMTLSIKID